LLRGDKKMVTQGFTAIRSKEMAKVLITTRLISREECPWLDEDILAGTTLWSWDGGVYECVGLGGVAVTAKAAETPFFEVPEDAVRGTAG
jgi:hypothetical protein